ncbi:nucleotidyltransferase [Clostridium sediminicola]|uniref:nucleotidyltransferase n=1 Tax=Clostridium sediminicola TaxID=3114879 RepID=UPI0031F22298
MKISGIITEYNPMHNGHLYHIEKTKEITNSDGIICVMSGNFVQRGIPAIMDKWTRTKIALNNGVDLVLELPVIYSTSSAEFFAYGSISLLNSLNNVDNIVFGSELGSVETIQNISNLLTNESKLFKEKLSNYLVQGISYPKARSLAFTELYKNQFKEDLSNIMNSSNNILGIEYCKSLNKLNSKIIPRTITRQGSSYNEKSITGYYSSATSIRNHLYNKGEIDDISNFLPADTVKEMKEFQLEGCDFPFVDDFYKYIKYKFLSSSGRIQNLPDVSEGINNRITKALHSSSNYENLVNNIKSKRYTRTRINRILCQYLIGFDTFNTSKLRKEACPYARILGFNKVGRKILKNLKNSSDIPLITKVPRKIDNNILSLDIQATGVYSLFNKSIKPNSDYIKSPIIIE